MAIRYLGINYLGFGIIPRSIMMNKNISINGKVLYSYFCAYSGGGVSEIPPINTISSELGIDERTLHDALDELRINKYLSYVMQDANRVNVTLHNNIQINDRETVTRNDYQSVKNMVKNNIQYDLFIEKHVGTDEDTKIIDEILLCICEMWYANSTVANGTNYRQDVVRDRIKHIDMIIMIDIMEQIQNQIKGKKDQHGVRVIRNPRNYIKAMIFNAVGKVLNDSIPQYC